MNDLFVEPGNAFAQLAGLDGQNELQGGATATGSREAVRRAPAEHFDVIVVGGGQAGLSVGYHLKRLGLRFVILDAHARIGDAWRKRWDSLKLFTPAWLDSLDGFPMPGPRDAYPTKDQMADYLESYAAHFALPVRTSSKVDRMTKVNGRFIVKCGDVELHADQVIIAMTTYQKKKLPAFASQLRSDIVQLHSSEYKSPAQLVPGAALIVGGGNSGTEIAMDLVTTRAVRMVGRDVGAVPFRGIGWLAGLIVMRTFFHRILTIRNPLGRKMRLKMQHSATPLIRTKHDELLGAGVDMQLQRIAGVRDGLPVLEDGRVLDVKNVIWCTGYHAGLSWIDLPIFDQEGHPQHEAGVVTKEPGLYFVGLQFLYAMSSSMVHGVGRDAARIAGVAASRASVQQRVA